MGKALTTTVNDSLGRRRRLRMSTAVGGSVLIVAAIAIAVVESPAGGASAPPAAAAGSGSPTGALTTMSTPSNPHTADPSFFPPSNGPGQATITQAQAVSSARAQAVDPTGAPLTVEEQAQLPTYSRLMSYADAVKLVGDGADPRIDPSRQVWVVTVIGHHLVDTLPGSKTNPITDKYTIVTDATSGFMILGAFGVAALTS